jgi:hypothetical protein
MDREKILCENMARIQLAQDRVKFRVFVMMNLQTPHKQKLSRPQRFQVRLCTKEMVRSSIL